MIHQIEIGRDDYDGRRITGRPEWHNPVMFIAGIEQNTSSRQRKGAPADPSFTRPAAQIRQETYNLRDLFPQVGL
jgi:hypothetical protein